MSELQVLCDGGDEVECDNCEWEGDGDDLDMIVDAYERLEAGGVTPAGQCPECGALAYLKVPPKHSAQFRADVCDAAINYVKKHGARLAKVRRLLTAN